jgi:hypothetical protein
MLGTVLSEKEKSALGHARNYFSHDYELASAERQLTLDEK